MSSNITFNNVARFIGLLLLQVLVFKQMALSWSGFNYAQIYIYPIFVLLLPVRLPHALAIGAAFLFGLAIDTFYNSLGIHAGACVFSAFIRPLVLGIWEPRGGYDTIPTPSMEVLGTTWFARYAAVMLVIHLFFYFSIDAFSFVFMGDILIKTIFSFLISYVFIMMYQFLFAPKV